jgi:porin
MLDYSAVILSASETLSSDNASGGILRAFGDWSLTGNGGLVWKFEHRHKYGSLSPFDFSLGSMGYVGLQEPPFNDSGFRIQNMYWRQRMNGGRSTLIAGVLDATDYVDAFALASPWLHFMNFAFSTGSASIGLPNDGAWGAAFGTMFTDRFYMIAGLTDTNGDPTNVLDGLDTFFSDHEFFTSIEFGWTTSHERIIFDNAHVTFWHKDLQEAANISSGWGMAFSFSRYLNNNFMPFIRGGYADDGGSLLQKSLSLGIGWQTEAFDGLLGAAFNWGEPNEDTFAPGLDDQYAIEVFYRVPFLQKFAVTLDTQLIKDPALNPDASTIWMFNLRGRGAF